MAYDGASDHYLPVSWQEAFATIGRHLSALPDRAAYYPETNPLVPLYAHDPISFTPASKGIPVRIERSQAFRGADLSTVPPE